MPAENSNAGLGTTQALLEALRAEADLAEKALDFMPDPDLANETRVQIGMLRDAANEIERLAEWQGKALPLIAAIAIYGEQVSLSAVVEKARRLNEFPHDDPDPELVP